MPSYSLSSPAASFRLSIHSSSSSSSSLSLLLMIFLLFFLFLLYFPLEISGFSFSSLFSTSSNQPESIESNPTASDPIENNHFPSISSFSSLPEFSSQIAEGRKQMEKFGFIKSTDSNGISSRSSSNNDPEICYSDASPIKLSPYCQYLDSYNKSIIAISMLNCHLAKANIKIYDQCKLNDITGIINTGQQEESVETGIHYSSIQSSSDSSLNHYPSNHNQNQNSPNSPSIRLTSCLSSIGENRHDFDLYTQFYIQLDSICTYIQSEYSNQLATSLLYKLFYSTELTSKQLNIWSKQSELMNSRLQNEIELKLNSINYQMNEFNSIQSEQYKSIENQWNSNELKLNKLNNEFNEFHSIQLLIYNLTHMNYNEISLFHQDSLNSFNSLYQQYQLFSNEQKQFIMEFYNISTHLSELQEKSMKENEIYYQKQYSHNELLFHSMNQQYKLSQESLNITNSLMNSLNLLDSRIGQAFQLVIHQLNSLWQYNFSIYLFIQSLSTLVFYILLLILILIIYKFTNSIHYFTNNNNNNMNNHTNKSYIIILILLLNSFLIEYYILYSYIIPMSYNGMQWILNNNITILSSFIQKYLLFIHNNSNNNNNNIINNNNNESYINNNNSSIPDNSHLYNELSILIIKFHRFSTIALFICIYIYYIIKSYRNHNNNNNNMNTNNNHNNKLYELQYESNELIKKQLLPMIQHLNKDYSLPIQSTPCKLCNENNNNNNNNNSHSHNHIPDHLLHYSHNSIGQRNLHTYFNKSSNKELHSLIPSSASNNNNNNNNNNKSVVSSPSPKNIKKSGRSKQSNSTSTSFNRSPSRKSRKSNKNSPILIDMEGENNEVEEA